MSSFQYDLATPLNEYNVDEDDMPAFGKCKLEISFTKISGTPTFAIGLDPMKKPTCRSNAATKKVTCENDIKTLQMANGVWYKSSLIEESSTDFATREKIYALHIPQIMQFMAFPSPGVVKVIYSKYNIIRCQWWICPIFFHDKLPIL